MIKLNLPEYKFNIKTENSKKYIFDCIRKKYIVLTPEEYVRQNFISFLIEEKNFPKYLIAVEMSLKINNLQKRADIVLFDVKGDVRLIVECKAPEVNITQKAFDQIARYNMNFNAEYLIVTNGINHFCCKPDYVHNSYNFLSDIPNYEDILY